MADVMMSYPMAHSSMQSPHPYHKRTIPSAPAPGIRTPLKRMDSLRSIQTSTNGSLRTVRTGNDYSEEEELVTFVVRRHKYEARRGASHPQTPHPEQSTRSSGRSIRTSGDLAQSAYHGYNDDSTVNGCDESKQYRYTKVVYDKHSGQHKLKETQPRDDASVMSVMSKKATRKPNILVRSSSKDSLSSFLSRQNPDGSRSILSCDSSIVSNTSTIRTDRTWAGDQSLAVSSLRSSDISKSQRSSSYQSANGGSSLCSSSVSRRAGRKEERLQQLHEEQMRSYDHSVSNGSLPNKNCFENSMTTVSTCTDTTQTLSSSFSHRSLYCSSNLSTPSRSTVQSLPKPTLGKMLHRLSCIQSVHHFRGSQSSQSSYCSGSSSASSFYEDVHTETNTYTSTRGGEYDGDDDHDDSDDDSSQATSDDDSSQATSDDDSSQATSAYENSSVDWSEEQSCQASQFDDANSLSSTRHYNNISPKKSVNRSVLQSFNKNVVEEEDDSIRSQLSGHSSLSLGPVKSESKSKVSPNVSKQTSLLTLCRQQSSDEDEDHFLLPSSDDDLMLSLLPSYNKSNDMPQVQENGSLPLGTLGSSNADQLAKRIYEHICNQVAERRRSSIAATFSSSAQKERSMSLTHASPPIPVVAKPQKVSASERNLRTMGSTSVLPLGPVPPSPMPSHVRAAHDMFSIAGHNKPVINKTSSAPKAVQKLQDSLLSSSSQKDSGKQQVYSDSSERFEKTVNSSANHCPFLPMLPNKFHSQRQNLAFVGPMGDANHHGKARSKVPEKKSVATPGRKNDAKHVKSFLPATNELGLPYVPMTPSTSQRKTVSKKFNIEPASVSETPLSPCIRA